MLNEMRHWKTTIAVCSGPNSKITLRLRYYELFDIEFQKLEKHFRRANT